MYQNLNDHYEDESVRVVYQPGPTTERMPMVKIDPAAYAEQAGSPRRESGFPASATASGRKLSLPYVGERRLSSYGTYARTVLCAVDKSDISKDAFYYYLGNIWKMDDLIVLCHCPEPPHIPSFSFKSGLSLPSEKWRDIIEEANKKNAELEEFYESVCVSKRLRYKIRGESCKKTGEGICRVAEEEGVNLIVMGCRSINGVKRAFGGSVSEYVICNANVPCLVIPAPK